MRRTTTDEKKERMTNSGLAKLRFRDLYDSFSYN